ncbi:MAG: hypothetical protein ACXVI7_07590 [Halobacteriota archaeon]
MCRTINNLRTWHPSGLRYYIAPLFNPLVKGSGDTMSESERIISFYTQTIISLRLDRSALVQE